MRTLYNALAGGCRALERQMLKPHALHDLMYGLKLVPFKLMPPPPHADICILSASLLQAFVAWSGSP